jgi:hypothetical protein
MDNELGELLLGRLLTGEIRHTNLLDRHDWPPLVRIGKA